jgi:hypothetical protein
MLNPRFKNFKLVSFLKKKKKQVVSMVNDYDK